MAHPVCERLFGLLGESAKAAGAETFMGGTYLVMEGPQFSTLAESNLYRLWKCDVIGMTSMPEAKLAREAELPYAGIAMVTDFDCWHEEHGHASVADIVRVMHDNAEKAKALIVHLVGKLQTKSRSPSTIDNALEYAIITAPEARDPRLVAMQPAPAARARQSK